MLEEGDRKTVIPLKEFSLLGHDNIFLIQNVSQRIKLRSHISLYKHRLFGLLHKASSFQSVIVFPDAKSLCLPLPSTITPLLIPD